MPEEMFFVKRGDVVSGPFPLGKILKGFTENKLRQADCFSSSSSGPWVSSCLFRDIHSLSDEVNAVDLAAVAARAESTPSIPRPQDPVVEPPSIMAQVIGQLREGRETRRRMRKRERESGSAQAGLFSPVTVYIAFGAIAICGLLWMRLRSVEHMMDDWDPNIVTQESERVTRYGGSRSAAASGVKKDRPRSSAASEAKAGEEGSLAEIEARLLADLSAPYEETVWITTHDLQALCEGTFSLAGVNAADRSLSLEVLRIRTTPGYSPAEIDMKALVFLVEKGFVKCSARVAVSGLSVKDGVLACSASANINSYSTVMPSEQEYPIIQRCAKACVGVSSAVNLKIKVGKNGSGWVFEQGSWQGEPVNAATVKRVIRGMASGLCSAQVVTKWKQAVR